MISASNFYVFEKWKNATSHAFGSQTRPSIVSAEDKSAYASIFHELMDAAQHALDSHPEASLLKLRPMGYSVEYGSRGHRPVDLWVSICRIDSETFGHFPQLYVIASERGVELGFAASIDEADYYNPEVKARNRVIVPLLNAKLPGSNDPVSKALNLLLDADGDWRFNSKTRLTENDEGFDQASSLANFLNGLKASGEASGGGAVCRVHAPTDLGPLDLREEFSRTLRYFYPLMARCSPTSWDAEIVQNQDDVSELVAASDEVFNPANITDARIKVLAEVARRLGQAGFRKKLLKAYGGTCAITGTGVANVLQAAHITPYLGAATNEVTNGILLRADIHTLFDLRLIRIDPSTLSVQVSHVLMDTPYWAYDQRPLTLPATKSHRPSPLALQDHFNS